MSMEPEDDYLPSQEDLGDHDLEDLEKSPKRQRTQHQRSHSAYSVASSSDNENGTDEGRPRHKRRAQNEIVEPVLKRHKGVFNNNYLDLLNEEIQDVVHQTTVGRDDDMPPSQIGLTTWTSYEKKLFFEALSRLGKDDLPGISAKIQNKSEIEVRQYILLLQAAVEGRDKEQDGGNKPIHLADYPAALEISPLCCHALDEAADALSFRQERHEEIVEQKKWGECWNINLELAKRIEGDHGLEKDPTFASDHGLAFTEVLRVKSFLRLPEHIFMNASNAENNWQYVSEEPPTIRATALQDFHSLLVSVTKKIVLTTLFIAQSRIRAKKHVEPSTRNLVRRKDVEAAVASLGMKQNSDEFWTTCARRLRLEVYDDDAEDVGDDEDEEPMSYDRVESILRSGSDSLESPITGETSPTPQIKFEKDEMSASADDEDSVSGESSDEAPAIMDDAEREVVEEAKEVLVYSAYDFPETHRTREALKNRIRNELAQEAYAEAEDAKASRECESDMWRLLQRQPPEPLITTQTGEPTRQVARGVEDLYDVGRRWREKLVYHSEWEMLGTSQLQDKA
ncbi:hypothetical protein BDP81DRAFT_458042 [Colletotrichum phormii]|uniref:RNA polymerase I-specific transcription initiation factor rrn5 n=1 Tax=Colletotrichum phormii TaxID=359342 RepID=A0AAI9ZZN7_9PEZI|nr:uncharacterized protein BDP81DRAFT_458042 [Colletotrichum phormii]KAK1641187.1 hypothetical protein BDP81DRAFT_458042 [Colletotrichum phormii]